MAAIEKLAIAPPENRSSMPTSWFWAKTSRSTSGRTPGTGTCEMKRKTSSIAAVNRSLRRRSAILNALTRALSSPMGYLLDAATGRLDPLAGRLRETMGPNRHCVGQLAVCQDLDQLAVVEQAGCHEL